MKRNGEVELIPCRGEIEEINKIRLHLFLSPYTYVEGRETLNSLTRTKVKVNFGSTEFIFGLKKDKLETNKNKKLKLVGIDVCGYAPSSPRVRGQGS